MRTVVAGNDLLFLGVQGENNAVQVQFPVVAEWKEKYGDGTFQLLYQRKTDDDPYACTVTTDDTNVLWTITNTEVAVAGMGKCELHYTVGTTIAISVTYMTMVSVGMGDVGSEVPEAWESWVEDVLEAAESAEASAEDAEESASEIENLTVSATTLSAGSSATVTKTGGSGTAYNLAFGIPKGDTGATGSTGATGNGISGISKTGTSGLVDTYTITFTDGTTSTFTVTNGEDGEAGTTVFNELTSRPSYNGSAMTSATNIPEVKTTAWDGAVSDIATVETKIPTEATSSNQLADKAFVNSSIATNTANYISNNGEPFTSVSQLEAYSGTVTNNDYAFVTGTDSEGNTYYDRYKATVSSSVTWAKEYRLNNSTFTASQWSAITSGITSTLVGLIPTASEKATWNAKYTKASSGIPKTDLASDVQTSLGKADTALQSHQDISGKENSANKVTTVSSDSTDTQYPSAKCVYDLVGNIESLLSAL